MAEHVVDAAIRAFALVMAAGPNDREDRLREFQVAWTALLDERPAETAETLAARLSRLGVPPGQALVDVAKVLDEIEDRSAARQRLA